MTTTIHFEGKDYAIFKEDANLNQYGVFKWTGSFWQQVGDWYFNKGSAYNKYKKLTAK